MSTILFWMHLCTHSKIAILPQFLTSNVHFARKGSGGYLKIANVHFVRQGCDWHLKSQFFFSFWRWTSISRERVVADTSQNRNFTSVFDVERPFRAKGLWRIPHKIGILLQFWRSTFISCERVEADTSKSQFFFSFDVQRPFRARGLRRTLQNRSFYFGFGRPMCTECCACHVSWRSGGTAPALRER